MRLIILLSTCLLFTSCNSIRNEENVREMTDTVGFASKAYQMDTIMNRIQRNFQSEINNTSDHFGEDISWKLSISPHDDYAYASYLYPAVFKNIKANVLFLIGVFHKAKIFDTYDAIVMGRHTAWQGPYGNTRVSQLNQEILEALPDSILVVKDSIMEVEHSLEALLPYIQYYIPEAEIIPMLIPYTKLENMQSFSKSLAGIIAGIARKKKWEWGKDFSIIISNDAVHYGDEGWGDKNFAYYGTDESGYQAAIDHEKEIIDSSLSGELTENKILKFLDYTVEKDDYKEYKWTWCGRYSIPFGLYTALYLQDLLGKEPLKGMLVGYATSIDHPKLEVEDLGMGVTAPANKRHWVGYSAIGYK